MRTDSLRIKHQHPLPPRYRKPLSPIMYPHQIYNPIQHSEMRALYHEKVINAGFSASGNSKCETVTVAMGRMATKSVIFQS